MNPLSFPPFTQYVNDFSGVLLEDTRGELNELFAQHETQTNEQVVVVLFPHRQGNELIDIGLKLFNENGIGQKNLNNGLLLIIATEEKKIRIITGKGVELKYTEMRCRDIIENHLRPLLNAEKYEELIQTWANIVQEDIQTEDAPNFQIPHISIPLEKILPILVILSIIGLAILGMNFILFIVGILFAYIGWRLLKDERDGGNMRFTMVFLTILLWIISGLSLYTGVKNIECLWTDSPACTEWRATNFPPPSDDSYHRSSSDHDDWGGSSSDWGGGSSSFDGGGGSSNGGGWGD